MKSFFGWLLIILLLPIHYLTLEKIRVIRPIYREERVFLPHPFMKVFSGEFKGIISDFLVIDLSSYYGGIIMEKKEAVHREFEYIYGLLKVAAALDPYFFDTYYFTQSILAWDAKMPQEANELLKIGMEKREKDWLIPYWIGFNYYYFLNDRKKAAFYLREASKRPNASDLLASMSAIVSYEGGETEMAILFLEDMIGRTNDEYKREKFLIRLDALKKILYLERGLKEFERRYKRRPKSIEELIATKIISTIPKDPYGGKFYIDNEGKVKTTSNLRFVRRAPK